MKTGFSKMVFCLQKKCNYFSSSTIVCSSRTQLLPSAHVAYGSLHFYLRLRCSDSNSLHLLSGCSNRKNSSVSQYNSNIMPPRVLENVWDSRSICFRYHSTSVSLETPRKLAAQFGYIHVIQKINRMLSQIAEEGS